MGEEYRYIISNKQKNKKYILVSFERYLEIILPSFFSRNQVDFLDSEDRFDQLLYELNDIGEYLFPEVNPNKTIPPIQHLSTKKGEDNNFSEIKAFSNCNRYNLLVSVSGDAWEAQSHQFERSRCLTSYTSQKIKEEYASLSTNKFRL